MKLFYHEAMRQYADKILMKHDLDWFMATLQQVCMETFDMNEKVNFKTEKCLQIKKKARIMKQD